MHSVGVNRRIALIVRAHGPEKQTSRFWGRCPPGAGKVRATRIGQENQFVGRLLKPKLEWLSQSWIEKLEAVDCFGHLITKAVVLCFSRGDRGCERILIRLLTALNDL